MENVGQSLKNWKVYRENKKYVLQNSSKEKEEKISTFNHKFKQKLKKSNKKFKQKFEKKNQTKNQTKI